MKKILPIICISAFVFLSCQKNGNDLSEINGSWKLIEVYDKNTSIVSHKPAGSDLDVVITFLNSNNSQVILCVIHLVRAHTTNREME